MNITKNKTEILHTIPLRDLVIFPNAINTLAIGRKKSINTIIEAKKNNLPIFAINQIHSDSDEFSIEALNKVGTMCNIVEHKRLADGTLKIVLAGIKRAKLLELPTSKNIFAAKIEVFSKEITTFETDKTKSLFKSCMVNFEEYIKRTKIIPIDMLSTISGRKTEYELTDIIASLVGSNSVIKQQILEITDNEKRLIKIFELLEFEMNALHTDQEVQKNIQEKISKGQKEIYLNEQLKHIKKELGHVEDDEIIKIKQQIKKVNLSDEAREKCNIEVAKLEKIGNFSSEYGVVKNYLDTILSLPWKKYSKTNNDLEKSLKILDKNHYSLEKIKERILEFLAVQIKTKSLKGPIICFVGPPGVGKTSLAKSCADAVGRKYAKVSLGGVRDESEIRGHRRTYIGSMPGKIIQSIKKIKCDNPLILLDEIDKMASDFRGDPASAMLEVLDPEQNKSFNDHYMEVEYDLSKIMFIATANDISQIPIPLRDRMEIIQLSGYSESEKLSIALDYLIPKIRKENALNAREWKISNDAILKVIREYSFEAGVRNLERELSKIARKITKKIVTKELKSANINEESVKNYLGAQKFDFGKRKKNHQIGVTTGLAYTQFGGDLLDIEVVKFDGSGKINITGKLGDVMKESVQTALSYVRSIAKDLNIDVKNFNKIDFHIHVPEGATPKDGPSAGVAICQSFASVLTQIAVSKDVAMTGEVTLTGKVLAIGGLKEKLLAALRGGIKTVLIPKANEKDLEELPQEIIDNLQIKPITTIKEAFPICLVDFNKKQASKTKKIKKLIKNG
ncbi:endopeptidase La [Rickettsiales bacterium]|nr:endopeptidase La [Rickettsiales bacterium]MDB2550841.1 endopeptidase La [Rickettsiales bacterium]